MPRNQAKALLAAILFFISCVSFAQSPGGIQRQSYWMRGKPSLQTQAVNFNPVIDLQDTKTTGKLSRQVHSLKSITAFTVYETTASKEEVPVWQITGDFGDLSLTTKQVASQSNATNLIFLKNQPAGSKFIIHTYSGQTTKHAAAADGKDENAAFLFGKVAAQNAQPAIAEFILYESVLSDDEIARIETYLALKYGITLETNYVNSHGKTVWNYEADKNYSNNVAGIGRDDQSTLQQKQGTSVNTAGQLVIGLNKIEVSNAENKAVINDNNYLIWGDNAQPFLLQENAGATSSEITLLQKKWLMKASGSGVDKLSTELKVDVSSLLHHKFSKEHLQLVIDRSGNGQFTTENCSYIAPDNISKDGIASFSNVTWDADASGKDMFTLGVRSSVLKKVAAKDAANLVSFQLYPNPVTTGQFRMAVTLDKVADIQVRVYDGNQRLVHSGKGNGQSSYVFTGYINSAAGSYTVRLTTPDTEYSRIIIVQ